MVMTMRLIGEFEVDFLTIRLLAEGIDSFG